MSSPSSQQCDTGWGEQMPGDRSQWRRMTNKDVCFGGTHCHQRGHSLGGRPDDATGVISLVGWGQEGKAGVGGAGSAHCQMTPGTASVLRPLLCCVLTQTLPMWVGQMKASSPRAQWEQAGSASVRRSQADMDLWGLQKKRHEGLQTCLKTTKGRVSASPCSPTGREEALCWCASADGLLWGPGFQDNWFGLEVMARGKRESGRHTGCSDDWQGNKERKILKTNLKRKEKIF